MKSPRASVIVPSHAGAGRLPPLLAALEAQDFTGDWEVVIVLDGHLDASPDLVAAWLDRLPLRVHGWEQSRGLTATLNEGYAQAAGQVLIRLDDDLTPRPDMITRHVAHHEANGPVGVIGLTRDVFDDSPYARGYGIPANRRALADGYAAAPGERWRYWAAHNSIGAQAFRAVGGFDPALSYREDSDLGWRLAASGVSMVIDPDLEIEHRGPVLTARARARRAYGSGWSLADFERRHPDTAAPAAPDTRGRAGVWDAAVTAVAATIRGARASERAGALVDAALPIAPGRVGGRLAALVIESSARAGVRAGQGGSSDPGWRRDAEAGRAGD